MNRVRAMYESRNEPESLWRFAAIYWHTVLGLALFLTVLIFGYSMWVLFSVFSELSTVPTHPSPSASPFDRASLSATVQLLDARQAQFDALKTNPSAPITDPSK